MSHHVSVYQLQSPGLGEAYLNVIDNKDGRISVWGNCYDKEVFFVQRGTLFELIVFDSKEYAAEWLEENPGHECAALIPHCARGYIKIGFAG